MSCLRPLLLAGLMAVPLAAQAMLPEGCALDGELSPVAGLEAEAHYAAEVELKDGRPRAITVRVIRHMADRRGERAVISDIDTRLRRLHCPGVERVVVEVRVGAAGGRIVPVGFTRAVTP